MGQCSRTNITLIADSITKIYPNNFQALSNVNLKLESGIFGLLGPNGAGKSTLMRIIVGLQQPDSGRIIFCGDDVFDDIDKYRRCIGYLPQDFGLYPNVNALQLLDYFAQLKGISKRKQRKEVIEGLLFQTNLWEKRNDKLGSFSGGMKQRFGLAQALLGNPSLLVIDEPTSGLDPDERYRLLNLLEAISKHTIILLSTHIVQDVEDICPNFAILDSGQLLISGDPFEARSSVRNRIWRIKDNEQSKVPLNILSRRFIGGKPYIHVFSENAPGAGAALIEPSLEDFYFSQIRRVV